MMRSMWSGVAGLTSEQKAMDVVGNNIANLNTVGFKESRVIFADVLSQTLTGATSPVNNLGGRNPLQIGLGDSVAAVDKIFSQGSLESTSKITDLAIQGAGFFVLSGDGGQTYRYTRAGDFSFDGKGNLVNPQGLVVQGWMADQETHKINSAASVEGIVIPPNMTVPAGITKNISITANLNGGDHIEEMAPAEGNVNAENKTVTPDDMAVLFNSNGDSLNIGKTVAKFAQPTDQITATSGGSFSGIYDENGDEIHLASGAIISMNVFSSGKTHTLEVSYGTVGGFKTLGSFAAQMTQQAINSGLLSLAFYVNSMGEVGIYNGLTSAVTIGNIQSTGDLNGYFAHGLINLQGGEGNTATIDPGKSRTSLSYLEHPGTVISLSYDGGANYYGYIYSYSPTGEHEFRTIQDFVDDMQTDVQNTWGDSSTVSVDPKTGEIVVTNNSPDPQTIGAVYSDNIAFATVMGTLSGLVNSGSSVTSQPFEAAVHTTSIDVYDSLGNKHTLTFTFRKSAYDPINKYSTWRWTASAPQPAEITNNQGIVKFDETGKLVYLSSPLAITANWNNGTASQVINLNFGKIGTFTGLTQFSLPSQTTAETQDGYPGGSLQRMLVNQDGIIEGIFSNGKSYPLAQVALAKFSNDEGLAADGNSLFSETANSGSALIGTPGTGGRGTIAPSHLEMSNVDLATEFTHMILFERAFQANARSITTSDQMIQELLTLKR